MITLQDLGLAYRKAKVDLYYSSNASLDAIADYEEALHANLSALLDKIQGNDESWVTQPKFIGDWTLVPKSVDMSCCKQHGNGLIFSSPAEEWEHACKLLAEETDAKESIKPKAEFRIMAQCTLDFHVLSALWMLQVGHLFDAKLTNCSYGNRLRRTQDGHGINTLSLGSFKPYITPFRNWRDKGIEAMRTALESGKKVVALTADVSSFYHELNPEFMLDDGFIQDTLRLELSDEQKKLHRLFIRALQAWAQATPLKKGLPVGLPASAVVANTALVELDRLIEQQVAPIYYGRYVDDILLVMENGANFRSTVEVWEWLFARSDDMLVWAPNEHQKSISFQPDYLSGSQIRFDNDKNKVFMLAGEPGRALVGAIAHQIYERASEWRAMPRLPRDASHIGIDLLAATQSDGEAADNLRKTDALTMRRASFAIKLRDFEAYERDLEPSAWREHRHAFFRAFTEHVLVLPQFFNLAGYLPRIIRLAAACEDFEDLRNILDRLEQLCKHVQDHCKLTIKACLKENQPANDNLLNRWRENLVTSVRESISAAIPPRLSREGQAAWQANMADYAPFPGSFSTQHARLFSFDLAHLPFRFIGLPKEMVAQRGIPAKKTIKSCPQAAELLADSILSGYQHLANWTRLNGLPNGFLFATRPYNLPELSILNKAAYDASQRAIMQSVIRAVRGFKLEDNAPCFDKKGVLKIPDSKVKKTYGVAVSSWKTQMSSWTASVMRMPDPDADRYARLCRLLNNITSQPQHSRYLVLPELALPVHWFIRIARKLHVHGISLITGVQYLHARKAHVRNQIWAAFSYDGLGFPTLMVYRQDKQHAALHEEQELWRLAGLKLSPEKAWKTPPIVQHGDFRFAMLICSELTNIHYRAALRGKVDVLFALEWNQDTETFNSLVESAALDIHAYIIQCNDRQYGDSRIRAPFKESWQRDLLRVKGGVTDYCVIGKIDVQALRRFQSGYRSPTKPFKPVPDGFEIDFSRKVLPAGENE